MPQAFFDGYDGLELELPNGHKVKAKVLPLAKAVEFLRLWGKRKDDPEAAYTILTEFPAAVGLVKEMDELTIAEAWDVFDAFFDRRTRPGNPATPAPTPTPAPSPGTIS